MREQRLFKNHNTVGSDLWYTWLSSLTPHILTADGLITLTPNECIIPDINLKTSKIMNWKTMNSNSGAVIKMESFCYRYKYTDFIHLWIISFHVSFYSTKKRQGLTVFCVMSSNERSQEPVLVTQRTLRQCGFFGFWGEDIFSIQYWWVV